MKTINDQNHAGSAAESPVYNQEVDSIDDQLHNDSPGVTGEKGRDIELLSDQNHGRLSHQFTWFLFVILSINTCVAAVISGIHFKNEYVSLMQSRVETVGNNMKTFMEDILGLGLPIGSLEGIEKELEKTVNGDLKAIYANVVDENSRVMYSYPERKIIDAFYPNELSPLLKGNLEKTFSTASAYNTFIPLQDPTSNTIVGGINIGIPKKFVYSKTIDSLSTLIATFIVFIIVTLVLLYWSTKRTIKPLEALTHGALALAKGNLSVRADVTEKNEIGFLAESFNYMAERLEQDRHKLTAYNVELEKRNNKLQRAHEHILQREHKLKSAQSQLVLSEKMASLGVLIAGIAHEINTPAGAIANVASDLRGRIQAITCDLMKFQLLA